MYMTFYSTTSEEFIRVYEVCAPWRERVRVCYARITNQVRTFEKPTEPGRINE